MKIDLEEIGTPIPFKRGKCKTATNSNGHGIKTTALQLTRAYSILGNGGYKIQPNILKNKKKSLKKKSKLFLIKQVMQ